MKTGLCFFKIKGREMEDIKNGLVVPKDGMI